MKSISKPGKNDATGAAAHGTARKSRRLPKPADDATSQVPASDSAFAQPDAERKEGYELNDTRARWDSGKQVAVADLDYSRRILLRR